LITSPAPLAVDGFGPIFFSTNDEFKKALAPAEKFDMISQRLKETSQDSERKGKIVEPLNESVVWASRHFGRSPNSNHREIPIDKVRRET
jgi:hypothetical protein